MKRHVFIALFAILFFLQHALIAGISDPDPYDQGEYTLVVEGFDWGPAVNKVILSLGESLSEVNYRDFTVEVERSTACFEMPEEMASGSRSVIYAYVSDSRGRKAEQGNYATLVMQVAPHMPLGSPIQYSRNDNCRGNQWINYHMNITQKSTLRIWNQEADRILPLVDKFDLTGKFTYDDDLTMSYASYEPAATGQRPLFIWLHGGGEGGTDPSIPLIANRAANYASDEIQTFFGGAYVLVPQCPGAWMHNAQGSMTHGEEDDVYNQGLMALIRDYVETHPKIDRNRIYVGGCSNGGYMSLKLILLYPDYFAAGYISALAYQSKYISDQEIEAIKDVPIWFVHAKDDQTTVADKTVVPVYERLTEAGAESVYFSFYDHVVDITGFFGGEDYHYNGHWSWIYCHANECQLDVNGNPVMLEGRPVTIMEWLAAQKR